MATIKDYKYKLYKNFFTKEELDILQPYAREKLKGHWTEDDQCPLSPRFNNDPLMNVLHIKKKKLVEQETGLRLIETYNYFRYYMYNSILKDHKDRPACEISLTACIKKEDKWPIHMEGNWFELEEGDAVFYLGCDVLHGRKDYKGEGVAQVFFHYVDADGPYTDHAFDQINKLRMSRGY